jgi:hypothetical protein
VMQANLTAAILLLASKPGLIRGQTVLELLTVLGSPL